MIQRGKGKYWFVGKSSTHRREYAAALIYQLLPADGSKISFSELKRRAKEKGLSSATLSQHLKTLVEEGQVLRDVDASTRPPSVRYSRLVPEKLKALEEPPLNIIGDVEAWLDRLSLKKDRLMVQRALEAILKIDLNEQMARLINAFYEASTKDEGEAALKHLRVFMEYVFVPRILKLGLLCWDLKEEADPATKKLLEYYLEEAKRAVDMLQLAIKKEGGESV
jgi:DNA-binding HxlR family transcriptional regulator